MAYTTVPTGSTLTQKAWRPGLIHQVELQAHMMGFVSPDDDSGIVLLEDLTKKRGDKIQIRFSPTDDTSDGFSDTDTVEGNEEKIDFLPDEMKIDYLAFAFAQAGQMSQQRVSFDLKAAAFIKAVAKWTRRFEESICNQFAGYTPAMGAAQDNYKRTGLNPVTQLDTAHILYSTAGAATYTTDQGIAADDTAVMTLDGISDAVLKMMTKAELTYPIAPCPDGFYHCVMHPYQWRQLRDNTSAGDWGDIVRATLEGGRRYEDSPLARGWLGTYNNTKLHVSDWVPNGVTSTDATLKQSNARRAFIFGARGAHMAFGEGYADGNHLDWVEQTRDYRKWGVLADSCFGVKRTIFNSQTYASLVLVTYSKG